MSRFFSWTLILGALGLVLALFALALYRHISGAGIFAFIVLSFVIGGATSAACYRLAGRLSAYSTVVHLAANLTVAAVIGVVFSSAALGFVFPLFDSTVRLPTLPYVLATTTLSLVITAITTIVERHIGSLRLASPLSPLSPRNPEPFEDDSKSLSLREEGSLYIIPHQDIVYLSSADDRTVVHTEAREFVTVRPLKNVLASLPPDRFVRLHRSYAVHVRYVLRLEYVFGGQLVVYLKDSEATSLPVGRSHIPEVKRRFGIMS